MRMGDEMLLDFYNAAHKSLYDLGALKIALEETILDNVLCPQLVKHMCSIWIPQENICGHICFGTNEEEKKKKKKRWISSLDEVHQNLTTRSSFCRFKAPSRTLLLFVWLGKAAVAQIDMCEYMGAVI